MSKSSGSIAPLPPPLVSALIIQLAILHLKIIIARLKYVHFTRNVIHNSQVYSLYCINVNKSVGNYFCLYLCQTSNSQLFSYKVNIVHTRNVC